jgi:hypothetical protein
MTQIQITETPGDAMLLAPVDVSAKARRLPDLTLPANPSAF